MVFLCQFQEPVQAKGFNPTMLSYGDARVTQEDYNSLAPGQWLTNQLIRFYCEYLKRTIFKDNNKFIFMDPAVVQLIATVDAGSNEFRKCFRHMTDDTEIIFFPVNSGRHWSLLLFWKIKSSYYLFDSDYKHDFSLKGVLNLIDNMHNFLQSKHLVTAKSLRQKDNYNCGVHVLCYADYIATNYKSTQTTLTVPAIEPSMANNKRVQIQELIMQLVNDPKSRKYPIARPTALPISVESIKPT